MRRQHIFSRLSAISILFLLLMASCNQQRNPDMVSVCGNAALFQDTYIKLVRVDTAAYTVIDSVKPGRDGSFCLNFLPEMAGFYLLRADNKVIAPLVILPGDSIIAEIRQDTVIISGGAEAGTFDNFRRSLLADEEKVDSLGTILMLARDLGNYTEIKQETDAAYYALMQNAKRRGVSYLQQNQNYFSMLLVINSKIQQSFLFDEVNDSSWFFYADSMLINANPENPHALAYHKRMQLLRIASAKERKAIENMKAGNKAPSLGLPGLNGLIEKLDPAENRFTLVYFWSPADALSRKANLELKTLYDQYKGKNFEVFAVSLDKYPDRWKAAVNLDKLWWANVNDTLALESKIAAEWYIQKLPVFVLLDQQGRIVERFTSVNLLARRLEAEY
ncbi:MAG: redoxin domain-containing protein [Lentimicrobium sp.]|nr:redoxin domain-containing protein [Lentimicrobium sp.]